MIPKIEYQDSDGKPVPSTADPNWKYTVINGMVRTMKDGVPQKLVNGSWVDISKLETYELALRQGPTIVS